MGTTARGRGCWSRPAIRLPSAPPCGAWLEDAGLRDRLRLAARERRAQLRPWTATASAVAGVLAGVADSVGDFAGVAR